MSCPLIVRLRAEHDMAEAGLWYESRRTGTGLYFIRCVDAAISLITRHPEAGPVQFGKFRRVLYPAFRLPCSTQSNPAWWSFTVFSTCRARRKRFVNSLALGTNNRLPVENLSRQTAALTSFSGTRPERHLT
jgi:hypothetical protein